MTIQRPLLAFCLAAIALILASPADAADKIDHIGSYNDWDAFTLAKDNGERLCYMISVPKGWKATRDGVTRGDIYITVTHRPKAKVRDQINIVFGYPLKESSEVAAVIDGKTRFTLFTEGDGAWLYSDADDRKMAQAMQRGTAIVIEGVSSRGTGTTDRYSLSGFTAARNAINRACPN